MVEDSLEGSVGTFHFEKPGYPGNVRWDLERWDSAEGSLYIAIVTADVSTLSDKRT